MEEDSKIALAEMPFTFIGAVKSNLIALAFTSALIGFWFSINKIPFMASREALYAFATCAIPSWGVAYLVNRVCGRPAAEGPVHVLKLTTDTWQLAPIAGSSMIAGWSAVNTDFAMHEGALLCLFAIIYSLWCIFLAVDLKETHRFRTLILLIGSHLLAPIAIGAVLAFVVNQITKPTLEEVWQDACSKAYAAASLHQCPWLDFSKFRPNPPINDYSSSPIP